MLHLIGIGLNDEKDITVKGLEMVKQCAKVYLEGYTSFLQVPVSKLEEFYEKKIMVCDRKAIEIDSDKTILREAKDADVALLVIGDPFGATTHTDLFLRAKKMAVPIEVVHNASILNAVGEVGLELYKFGKTTSIPFPEDGFDVETPYDVIAANKKQGLHTLVLLDLRPAEDRFMTVNQAIERLTSIEGRRQEGVFPKDGACVGCARLGSPDRILKFGEAEKVHRKDFGRPPHCLIVPGNLHFMEEDMLELWS
ncbi:MAG: diphthine synthase [DPANN group archaeon]|nr:diphthine synthase [DPANN group archaeon]